ncbi:MAG TPA: MFS transporter [Novosphingobium sp.]
MAANMQRKGGVYYGWYIVAMSFVALLMTTGTTMNAFGLYVLPASQEFGLSRASMNTGLILMNAGSAIAALVLGRLIDRYPARLIMGLSGLALGGSLIMLGLSHSLWLSALVLLLPTGFGMAGVGNLTSPTLVARWFAARRGRALAITMMGMSAATILVAPPVAMLIDRLGWRTSLIVLGTIVITVVTLLLPMARNAPGPDDHETAGATLAKSGTDTNPEVGDIQLSQQQLLAQPRFWAIGLSTAITQAIFQALIVSLIPIAHGIGFSTTMAAGLISALGLAGISGKVLVATFADRIDRALALTVLYALMPVACLVMHFAHGYSMLVLASALMGLASGATMPLYLALLADRFGARSLGSANGMVMFGIAVIGALAVRYAGEVYDRTGGYDIMFYSFIGLGLVAAGLMFATRANTAGVALVPAEK